MRLKMHQSNDDMILIDPLWLYYVFVRTFKYEFPSLSRKAIKIRSYKRRKDPSKIKPKKKLVPLRRKFNSPIFTNRSEMISAINNARHFEKYNRPNKDPNTPVKRKKSPAVIDAARPNDYCGVLRMEDLHKLGKVNICYAEI